MSKANYFLLPGLIWKIEGMKNNKFYTVKGPTLTIFGDKWNIELYYLNIPNDSKCSIFLKKDNRDKNVFSQLKSRAFFYNEVESDAIEHLLYDNYIYGSMTDYLVWEKKLSDRDFRNSHFETFQQLFENFTFCLSFGSCTYEEEATNIFKDTDPNAVVHSPCLESLKQDFGNLFNNPTKSDFIVVCGDKKIYAHSAILATRSKVFDAMLRSDMKESKERSVLIEDVEPLILEQLIRYIYSGEVEYLDSNIVYKLHQAADRFCMDGLMLKCGDFIANYENHTDYTSESLPDSKIELIRRRFGIIRSILKTEEWTQLSDDDPQLASKAVKLLVSQNPI